MLSFWITALVMVASVLALVGRTLLRPDVMADSFKDIDVYRDQLAEVERDLARGVVPPEEAARLRTEIARRILAADRQAAPTAGGTGPGRAALIGIAVLMLAGSVLLYRQLGAPGYGDLGLSDRIDWAEEMRKNRPDQASAEASLPAAELPDGLSPQFADLLTKLRETVSKRPDDLLGHTLLAENEAKIGNFAAAARALEVVVTLKAEDATVEDLVQLGEFYVLAAGGYVSPEAEVALRSALARDENNGTALYYLGLMLVQTARPDLGFRIWDRLLRQGPENAPWIDPIRLQILQVAELAGVDYEIPTAGTGASGPSAADIEAAQEMTAQERMEMIGGMVTALSDRLAQDGGPPAEWARLITSLGVLGERDRAAAIYQNALEVFRDDPGALDLINRAGERAGVAG